jgi:hypothetical protein
LIVSRCTVKQRKKKLNKYLHNDTIETEVIVNINVNNGSQKLFKKSADFSQQIIAVHASVVYFYISCTRLSSRLEYNSRFVGLGTWGLRCPLLPSNSAWLLDYWDLFSHPLLELSLAVTTLIFVCDPHSKILIIFNLKHSIRALFHNCLFERRWIFYSIWSFKHSRFFDIFSHFFS